MNIEKSSKKSEAIDINQSINNLINKAIEIVSKPDEANEKKITEFRDILESFKSIDKTTPYEILPDTQEKLKNLFNIDVDTEKTSKQSEKVGKSKKTSKGEKKLEIPEDAKEKYNRHINSQIDSTVKAINNVLRAPEKNEKEGQNLEYSTDEVRKVANNLLTGLLQYKLKNFTDINLAGEKADKEATEININTLNYRYDDGWFDNAGESIEINNKRTHEIDNASKSRKETVATSYDTTETSKEIHKVGKIPDLSYKKKSIVADETLVHPEKNKQNIDEEIDKTSKELNEVDDTTKTNKDLAEVDSETDKTLKELNEVDDTTKTNKDLADISTEVDSTEKDLKEVRQSKTETNKNLENVSTSVADNEKELNIVEDDTTSTNKNIESVNTDLDKNLKEPADVNTKNTTTDKSDHEVDYTTLVSDEKDRQNVETYNLEDTDKEINDVDTNTSEVEKVSTSTPKALKTEKILKPLTENSASPDDAVSTGKAAKEVSTTTGETEKTVNNNIFSNRLETISNIDKNRNTVDTFTSPTEKQDSSIDNPENLDRIDKNSPSVAREAINSQLDNINSLLGLPEGEGFGNETFQNVIGTALEFFSTNSSEMIMYVNKARRFFNTQVNAEQLTNMGISSAATLFTGELASRSISDVANDMGEKLPLTEVRTGGGLPGAEPKEDIVTAMRLHTKEKTTDDNSTDTLGSEIKEAYENWERQDKTLDNNTTSSEGQPVKESYEEYEKEEKILENNTYDIEENIEGSEEKTLENNTYDIEENIKGDEEKRKVIEAIDGSISERATIGKNKVDNHDDEIYDEISKIIKTSAEGAKAKKKTAEGRVDARHEKVKKIEVPSKVDETELKEARDLEKIGFLKIYTRRALNYNETTENGGTYKIPFQFEPEISGDAKAADYGAISTLAKSQSTQVYRRSTERNISLNLHYLVSGKEGNNSTSLSASGMNKWTEDYIYNYILINLKNLVLPNIGESLKFKLAPPIVQVWYGDVQGTSASSTGTHQFNDINPVFRTTWYDEKNEFRTMRSLWVCKNVSFEYQGGYISSNARRTLWVTAQLELTEIEPNAAANELMVWKSVSA